MPDDSEKDACFSSLRDSILIGLEAYFSNPFHPDDSNVPPNTDA